MVNQANGTGARLLFTRRVTVVLGTVCVAAASVGMSVALSAAGGDNDEEPTSLTPHANGAVVPAAAPTSAGAPAGQGGEAGRLHAMDPNSVARSVASEDAAVRSGSKSASASAVKGTWRVGEIGTYLVGRGIPAGEWESAAPTTGTCEWTRLRGLSGKPADVVQRGSSSGRSVVTLRANDKFFETKNCANWHKVA